MLRKWLFGGLTLLLGAVFVSLALKARREESRAPKVPAEIIKTARSSATRVMAPGDLEIAASKVDLVPTAPGPEEGGGPAARCRLVIRNRGQVAYHDVVLELSCIGAGGKVLGKRSHRVPDTIPAGQAVALNDISIGDLPRATDRGALTILYSSIGAARAR